MQKLDEIDGDTEKKRNKAKKKQTKGVRSHEGK